MLWRHKPACEGEAIARSILGQGREHRQHIGLHRISRLRELTAIVDESWTRIGDRTLAHDESGDIRLSPLPQFANDLRLLFELRRCKQKRLTKAVALSISQGRLRL